MEELEKEILESKEKIEFCRTKMQELVSISFLMPFNLALKFFPFFSLCFFVVGLCGKEFRPVLNLGPAFTLWMPLPCLVGSSGAVTVR